MNIALYNAVLFLGLLFIFPKTLWLYFFRGKYRKSLFLRFKSKAPHIENRSVIWLHGASLGEVKALSTLAPLIRGSYPNTFILISTITETGLSHAKKSIKQADAICFLPYDFSWIMRPFVEAISPKLLILIEGDFWPNFLKQAKQSGALIFVASAKLSKKSLNRYLFSKTLTQMCFKPIDHFYLQGQVYKDRLMQLGIHSKHMTVTGNLKFDILNPVFSKNKVDTFNEKIGLKKDDFILTCGSTHPREEKILLKILLPLLKKYPHFKVLIVPRHPERFQVVKQLLIKRVKYFGMFSSPDSDASVHLVDKVGILPLCYQVSNLAVVGGSFVKKIGGHNIFEPAKMGVPVLFGPYMHKQIDLCSLLKRFQAGNQVTIDTLLESIESAIKSPDLVAKMGRRGEALAQNVLGSAEVTWKKMDVFLKKRLSKNAIM